MYRDQPNEAPLPGQGYLILHVTTARGAIPLEGAQVSIRSNPEKPNATAGDVLATLVSGTDGNTARIPLDAPPRATSMRPGNGLPYASYIAEVRLDGYYDPVYSGIPLFDGITAIQPVDLIPLPENGTNGIPRPDGLRVFENSMADL